MPTLAEQIAEGLVRGAIKGFADNGPALMRSIAQAWRDGWTSTVVEAPAAPKSLQDAAKQELADAIKNLPRAGS